jgi:hypothetical protein
VDAKAWQPPIIAQRCSVLVPENWIVAPGHDEIQKGDILLSTEDVASCNRLHFLSGDTKLTRDYANKIGKPLLHIFDARKEKYSTRTRVASRVISHSGFRSDPPSRTSFNAAESVSTQEIDPNKAD